MKIVFVSSELVPFAKTGGLGDVAGTLSTEIQKLGSEVIAVLPRYGDIDIEENQLQTELTNIEITIGANKEVGRILSCQLESGVKVYFVDHPDFFDREGYYGTLSGDYPDNDRRFIFFQRAVLEMLKKLKYKADIIHCHDWQTGLIPVYLKTLYKKDAVFKKTRTVFTIHNLAYQGNFPPDSLPLTGLDWDQFHMERLEFYGKVSFLKAGILDGDVVSTVSEQYAKEIQTKEFGCGLEGVLAARGDKIHGIVNGIDLNEWDPASDKDLVENFSASNPEAKAASKADLQKVNEFKLDPKVPVVGIISRLVDQKGLDILIPALPDLMEMGYQFVLLGTGEEKYHQLLRQFAKKHHDACGVHIIFDSVMAKRIYAGCDMFLLPSYYEPCGLGQMISLRFGTIPIVRKTGGLADTIQEFNSETKEGNGFLFEDYTSEAFLEAMKRALDTFKDESTWKQLVQNAFACDYSWNASAKKYLELYESAKPRKVKDTETKG